MIPEDGDPNPEAVPVGTRDFGSQGSPELD